MSRFLRSGVTSVLLLLGCRASVPSSASAGVAGQVTYPDAVASRTDLDEYRYVAGAGSARAATLDALWQCTLRELPSAGWTLEARAPEQRVARFRHQREQVELFAKVDSVAALGRAQVAFRANWLAPDSTRVRILSGAPEWKLLTASGQRLASCVHGA